MIVFVHGVPETEQLWDKVRAEIDAPSTAVSLPGFGNPRPDGFTATKDAYSDWLTAELEKIGEPVDLVGHDWGAGFTVRVGSLRPDLIRSWTIDIANVLHPDYEWHDFAKIWQTPGEGEKFFEQQNAAPPEQGGQVFEMFGVPHDDAVALASHSDATMAGCILDLYRSAVPNPYADWGADYAGLKERPGLVVCPTEDPFGDETRAREAAETVGASFELLPGLGHWWALQDPKAGAAALKKFWSSLT